MGSGASASRPDWQAKLTACSPSEIKAFLEGLPAKLRMKFMVALPKGADDGSGMIPNLHELPGDIVVKGSLWNFPHDGLKQRFESMSDFQKAVYKKLTSPIPGLPEEVGSDEALAEYHVKGKPPGDKFTTGHEKAVRTIIEVDGTKHGSKNGKIAVHVWRPTDAAGDEALPLMYRIHGGGFVLGSADDDAMHASTFAAENGIVCATVDYTLMPACRDIEEMTNECYAGVKHLIEEASNFGIDSKRIAVMGESAGGHLTVNVAHALAKKGEADLVKFVSPTVFSGLVYITGDLDSTLSLDQHKKAVEENGGERSRWQSMALQTFHFYDLLGKKHGIELSQLYAKGDEYLFPLMQSDEMMKKGPKQVVITADFCHMVRDSWLLAARLQENDRLLDWLCLPGENHAVSHLGKDYISCCNQMIKAYLC
eukprot:TRINITY_DN48094_c0_g1_i1.p1 TRINITY_DN48094_c0_g1~~TRINITY_DN48094_c0_g1_i1.p1  ORF type:complete len:424 (+),score=91.03 TRINITY_DN48094_c0_g1_i1:55-1326(+)